MKQKVFLFIAVLVTLGQTAIAQYDFSYTYQGKTLFYTIQWVGGVSVVAPNTSSYSYVTGDVVIPDSVENNGTKYVVLSINNHAFHGCTELTSVIIPNTVRSIGQSAFYGCSDLTSITIGNSVNSIGYSVFQGCSSISSVNYLGTIAQWCDISFTEALSNPLYYGDTLFINSEPIINLIIPDGVTNINNFAFYNYTGLTSVTIPDGISSIGNGAFCGCSGLTSVTIGNTVTTIGSSAFSRCYGLTSATIPNTVTTIESNAFYLVHHIEYHGSALGNPWGAISMNGIVEGDFVYSSEDKHYIWAYLGSDDSVTIPSSVDTIGKNAFSRCNNLISLTIGDNVTSIEESAFSGCGQMTSISIGNGVTTIGITAFENCTNLTSITLGSGITSIGANAFQNCSGLTSITIPNSVTSIGGSAFYDCSSLTSVNYTGTITQWCNIDFNNYRSNPLFYSHNLNINEAAITNLIIPDSVTEIKKNVFSGFSSLTSVTILSGVTSIGYNAFGDCSGLTSVSIPSSITSIGSYAFDGCSGLTEIISLALPAPQISSSSFSNVPTTIPVYIPCGSQMSYYSRWSSFSNFIENEGFSFSVQSGDNTMGQVNILTTPTCQTPTAVFNAVANSGYRFDHWSDGNTDNPRYLTLSSDTSIVAMFVSTHSVNVSNALGGGEYIHGSTATLAALPQVGLQFAGWSDGETMNPRNIVVTSDTTLAALYRTLDTVRIYDTTIVYDTVINIVYDTTEYNHYYYDTTYVFDTLVVYDTTRVYDTLVYVHADTVHHYYYDTTLVYDTLVVYDTLNHYFYDTTLVYDTLVYVHLDTLNHYFFDTTRVYDTLVYVNTDTVHHYYYDTTLVYDTLAVYDTINHYFYDTTRVYDTLVYVYFDTLNHYYYDTTLVLDTLVYVHLDTLNHYYYDTIWVYDTLVYLNIDTVYHYYYDTTSMIHYIFDSTWIFDSVYIIDTIIVHDTIYITEESIDGVEMLNAKVYINNGQIVVDGAEGNQVWLYDINGRLLATKQDNYQSLRFDVHTSGTYLVKIGKYPARKVVVIR